MPQTFELLLIVDALPVKTPQLLHWVARLRAVDACLFPIRICVRFSACQEYRLRFLPKNFLHNCKYM